METLVNKYLTEGKLSSKFDIKGIVGTLRKAEEEMIAFNVSGSQDKNVQNVRKAISILNKIKM